MVQFFVRCWLLMALLPGVVAATHAADHPAASPVDAIELASSAGDFATALRLSADLIARTADSDPGRVAALQARGDALIDAGAWAQQSGELHAAIGKLSDPVLREALEIWFSVNDAANAGKYPLLLETAQKALGKNFRVPATFAAEMHGAVAKASVSLGDADVARNEAQMALDGWHRLGSVRARRYEVGLDMLLSQLEALHGNADAALQLADAAARIAADTFGPDSLARDRADDQRAEVLESLDRFPEARELRETVLKATRARYGDQHLRTASAEGSLGAHLQRTGNYAPAREHYAMAESIMRALPDVGVRDRVVLANNYANLLQEMGDEDAALEHYRIALALVTDKRTRAIILTNIGNTEFRLRRYEPAIADFNQALPLREQAEGKDSPGLSFALEGLGSSALALKRFADAEPYFARAVALRSKASAPNHSQLNVLNFGLALAHWGQGNAAEAFRLAAQTAQQQQNLLGSLATGFSEQQSVAYDSLLVPATPLAVTLAAEHGNADEIATAWRLVMIERGLIARAEARRLAIARANADPQLAQLYHDWRAANSVLGDAWTSSKTSAAQMTELQQQAEAAERVLWAKLGYRQDDLADAAKPWSDLARALPEDGLLVAFTEGVDRDAARIVNAGEPQTAEDLYAFVLRAHAAPRLLRIGRIDALTAQIRAWYGALRDPHSDLAQLSARGADLRRDLFGKIDGLEGKQTLFVIPFGDLFRVSFAALPEPGGERYWIESGMRVHTLSHESELLMSAQSAHARVLLAGAPEFGGASRDNGENRHADAPRQLCAQAAVHGFAPIPGAARELDELRGVLDNALGSSGRIQLIEGAQATKERVLVALDGANIVHIATHGFSFDESCANDHARGVSLDRSRAGTDTVAQPLSGLAFTGADVSGGHAPVGVLSAGEMSAADLSHVDWIALSACDSGLGPIGRNEGVFGMRRALRLAGARTVVMSLWQVDDAATADLMQSLYRARFAEHRNVPDAMAEAMRETLAARRAAHASTHPYYWAAFIGEGGWR